MNLIRPIPRRPVVAEVAPTPPEDEEIEIDPDYIIKNKPETKVVRYYFKEIVKGITDD